MYQSISRFLPGIEIFYGIVCRDAFGIKIIYKWGMERVGFNTVKPMANKSDKAVQSLN